MTTIVKGNPIADHLTIDYTNQRIIFGEPRVGKFKVGSLQVGGGSLTTHVYDSVKEEWPFVKRVLSRYLPPFVIGGTLYSAVAASPDHMVLLANCRTSDLGEFTEAFKLAITSETLGQRLQQTHRIHSAVNLADPNQTVSIVKGVDTPITIVATMQQRYHNQESCLAFLNTAELMEFIPYLITGKTTNDLVTEILKVRHRMFYPDPVTGGFMLSGKLKVENRGKGKFDIVVGKDTVVTGESNGSITLSLNDSVFSGHRELTNRVILHRLAHFAHLQNTLAR